MRAGIHTAFTVIPIMIRNFPLVLLSFPLRCARCRRLAFATLLWCLLSLIDEEDLAGELGHISAQKGLSEKIDNPLHYLLRFTITSSSLLLYHIVEPETLLGFDGFPATGIKLFGVLQTTPEKEKLFQVESWIWI